MIIRSIWVGNALRNFNYLVVCPQTGEALAIDPTESEACVSLAKKEGWTIRYVLNTHEHFDHISGNQGVCEATGATLLAHFRANIPQVDKRLSAGARICLGNSELECLDTPGHTMSHLCLFLDGDEPAIFTGDTLFNAGVGHCRGGGDARVLYETISQQLSTLSDNTRVYPGHDYLENNLKFTLAREKKNSAAIQLLEKLFVQQGRKSPSSWVSTMGLEREINTFLRLGSRSLIEGYAHLGERPTEEEVFLALRSSRDIW